MQTAATPPTASEEEVYEGNAGMTSLVSYPKRCALWGSWQFRGNCDGTLFLNLLRRYRPHRVADPMVGSGTTRDVVAGLNARHEAGIDYWGSDLHEGFDLTTTHLPRQFDFVWIHPPYWNAIRYSDQPNDLSAAPTYELFASSLRTCLQHCFDALAPGGRLAVLVGDVRRQRRYYPLIRDVLNLEGQLGTLRSVIIKAQHNCASDRRTYSAMEDVPIKHEYCIVFKK